MIFTAAAEDALEPMVESAFENVEQGKDNLFWYPSLLIKYVDMFDFYLL